MTLGDDRRMKSVLFYWKLDVTMEATWSGAEAAMKMKLDELKYLAEEVGVKQPGVGWGVCCPPNGRKEDIVRALCQYFNLTIPTTPTKPKTTPILPTTTDRNRPTASVHEDSSSKTRVDLLREKLTVTNLGNLKQGGVDHVRLTLHVRSS